ncbi:MAG: DEAD/DEAH box helicase, partial [Pseudomonadota bacterium]
MTEREKVQNDALNIAIGKNRCGLGISMGVGKTLIGLNYIDYLQKTNIEKQKVLVVAPKLSIFDSWKNDAEKFNIDIEDLEFTTYLSLNKKNPKDYDAIVLDECHSLLYSHQSFLANFTGKILGLTGTPPRHERSEKGEMVSRYCPIAFRYITDDAVESHILNDYRILVHKMKLSASNNIEVKLKDKTFYTSEQKNYSYWTQRLMDAKTKKQEQIASIMRMKAMMEYKTKEQYAKQLLNDIDDKCIIF